MKRERYALTLISLILLIAVVMGCAPKATPAPPAPSPAAPTTTAAPKPSPAATTPTAAPKPSAAATSPTAAPKPSPTPTPTPTAGPPFYQGKTITIIVSSDVGAGVDLWVRPMAKFLEQYIPGKPTIVVVNDPAGGGKTANNKFMTQKPDGLTMLGCSGGDISAQWLREKGVTYDFSAMRYLMSSEGAVLAYMTGGKIKEPADIVKASGLRVGGSTPTTGSYLTALIALEVLGVKTGKPIWGMSGADRNLGILKGEEVQITGGTVTGWLTTYAPYAAKGELMGLWVAGSFDAKGREARDRTVPQLPTLTEVYNKVYGKDPSGMAFEAFLALARMRIYDKLLLFPPGTPQNLVDIIWQAVDRLAKDPQSQAGLKKIIGDYPLGYGAAKEKALSELIKGRPDVIEWVRKFLTEKYDVVF